MQESEWEKRWTATERRRRRRSKKGHFCTTRIREKERSLKHTVRIEDKKEKVNFTCYYVQVRYSCAQFVFTYTQRHRERIVQWVSEWVTDNVEAPARWSLTHTAALCTMATFAHKLRHSSECVRVRDTLPSVTCGRFVIFLISHYLSLPLSRWMHRSTVSQWKRHLCLSISQCLLWRWKVSITIRQVLGQIISPAQRKGQCAPSIK